KRRAALTTRQKMIIQMLVRMDSEPVTVSAISEKLNVSSRTVLREMPVIERWFQDNDFRFVRKPGVGLLIDETPEQLGLIRELLEMEDVVPAFSRQERRRHLLGELLLVREPVKAYVFTSRYHISEGTLYGDLDALSSWLKDYHVTISRRPGVGICLESSESAYRQAMANAVFEFVEENKILALLSSGAGQNDFEIKDNQLLHFLQPDTVSFVKQILTESEAQLGVKFTDSGYMSMIVQLALVIFRLQIGKTVELDAEEESSLRRLPEYSVAERIADEIEHQFHVEVSAQEVGFITMHLSSARIWPQSYSSGGQLQAMNIRQIVMSMAGVVERLVGLPFRSCKDMVDDLVTHVSTMMSRLTMNLRIENSQNNSVKQNYPEIYSATETACEMLRELLQLHEFPEAEVGYIAMHFAAAAEKLQESEQRIVVVVVCPTGMGTSKMLAANLLRSFHNIEIRKIISAFGIDPEQLRRDGIDLILSTVALNADFPYLCVSPILQAQDKLLLQNEIDAINRRRIRRKTRHRPSPAPDLDSILRISQIGIEVGEIIQHFRIHCTKSAQSMHELLEQAGTVFAEGEEKKGRQIAEALRKREALSDTFISEMGVYLLHCRTSCVEHSRFGYLRLEHPMQTEKGTVDGAVIMLGPDEIGTLHAEVLSGLSILLVEDNAFLEALKNGNQAAAAALAEKALVNYYQGEAAKQIGIEWKLP
ncbi:MAG: BglG family transcription antiterminator, partial [Butyricicoccaceae bacterium]